MLDVVGRQPPPTRCSVTCGIRFSSDQAEKTVVQQTGRGAIPIRDALAPHGSPQTSKARTDGRARIETPAPCANARGEPQASEPDTCPGETMRARQPPKTCGLISTRVPNRRAVNHATASPGPNRAPAFERHRGGTCPPHRAVQKHRTAVGELFTNGVEKRRGWRFFDTCPRTVGDVRHLAHRSIIGRG